mmetsp:Transcript_6166/g.24016  ORF Transcript_6166/g.24016 Transcript_6166/m.24016 type:complete len:287 (-) Transcript_6166:1485-2345(-)
MFSHAPSKLGSVLRTANHARRVVPALSSYHGLSVRSGLAGAAAAEAEAGAAHLRLLRHRLLQLRVVAGQVVGELAAGHAVGERGAEAEVGPEAAEHARGVSRMLALTTRRLREYSQVRGLHLVHALIFLIHGQHVALAPRVRRILPVRIRHVGELREVDQRVDAVAPQAVAPARASPAQLLANEPRARPLAAIRRPGHVHDLFAILPAQGGHRFLEFLGGEDDVVERVSADVAALSFRFHHLTHSGRQVALRRAVAELGQLGHELVGQAGDTTGASPIRVAARVAA